MLQQFKSCVIKERKKKETFPKIEEHDRELNAVPNPALTATEELELNNDTNESESGNSYDEIK